MVGHDRHLMMVMMMMAIMMMMIMMMTSSARDAVVIFVSHASDIRYIAFNPDSHSNQRAACIQTSLKEAEAMIF